MALSNQPTDALLTVLKHYSLSSIYDIVRDQNLFRHAYESLNSDTVLESDVHNFAASYQRSASSRAAGLYPVVADGFHFVIAGHKDSPLFRTNEHDVARLHHRRASGSNFRREFFTMFIRDSSVGAALDAVNQAWGPAEVNDLRPGTTTDCCAALYVNNQAPMAGSAFSKLTKTTSEPGANSQGHNQAVKSGTEPAMPHLHQSVPTPPMAIPARAAVGSPYSQQPDHLPGYPNTLYAGVNTVFPDCIGSTGPGVGSGIDIGQNMSIDDGHRGVPGRPTLVRQNTEPVKSSLCHHCQSIAVESTDGISQEAQATQNTETTAASRSVNQGSTLYRLASTTQSTSRILPNGVQLYTHQYWPIEFYHFQFPAQPGHQNPCWLYDTPQGVTLSTTNPNAYHYITGVHGHYPANINPDMPVPPMHPAPAIPRDDVRPCGHHRGAYRGAEVAERVEAVHGPGTPAMQSH
ncbi:MAG: hypothetical protein M1833_001373 [Piccolia ochrophora]|nr:MAG: hypothetical protein M1833_001373 [Piccolia ochrophora]